MFETIKSKHGGVDICINNAGLSHPAPLFSGSSEQWRNMLDVSHDIEFDISTHSNCLNVLTLILWHLYHTIKETSEMAIQLT